ncbi:hypothetical protein BpHYR1_007841 [Brachionus plicatilis]|uniref:Uncharacterized protein n=1 Tax=Brachionus plicatilis TaxID=10195 RepID=A0A3M7S559_BRAPC|nr:hypothetical protein BpHYR1_007841 [Brachionus plicatilis]
MKKFIFCCESSFFSSLLSNAITDSYLSYHMRDNYRLWHLYYKVMESYDKILNSLLNENLLQKPDWYKSQKKLSNKSNQSQSLTLTFNDSDFKV